MSEVNVEQLSCNLAIDYNQVGGESILPFVIELDLQASNLQPGPNERQRFCYNITGVGQDSRDYADLSHFVLGICSDITEEEIVNVSVVIDGVEQEVIFGENVELRTPNNPDPLTGCAGLKFDFGLDKVDGEMTVCFELTRPYPIGPNEVCLFGGGRSARRLGICGPVCGEVEDNCDLVLHQKVKV